MVDASRATSDGFVDFYIDDLYLGTNNAFVPTRGSRFFIAHWFPTNKNHLWNGVCAVQMASSAFCFCLIELSRFYCHDFSSFMSTRRPS